jgi:acetyl-CoA carboxylase alpha subunit
MSSTNLAKLNMSSDRSGWEIKEGDNTLKVERKDLRGALYVQDTQQVVVRQTRDKVLMYVGRLTGQCIELSTPRAVELAMALVKEAGLAQNGEVVVLMINRVDLELHPQLATQIGGALVRKADKADDWQRLNAH